MKVKAKTNIKYGTEWFMAGMTFEAAEADLASFGDTVEAVADATAQPVPVAEGTAAKAEKEPEANEAQEKPKTTPRRKKTT